MWLRTISAVFYSFLSFYWLARILESYDNIKKIAVKMAHQASWLNRVPLHFYGEPVDLPWNQAERPFLQEIYRENGMPSKVSLLSRLSKYHCAFASSLEILILQVIDDYSLVRKGKRFKRYHNVLLSLILFSLWKKWIPIGGK